MTTTAGPDVWDERYRAKDLVWSLEPNLFVAAHLADLAPGTAVDLAAGEGRNALWLASRGWAVTAVDFSEVAIDRGRRLAAERGIDGVEWVVADGLAWRPDSPVDLVVLSYFQLPEPQRSQAVAAAASWVAPGGTFFLVGHDQSNVTDGYGGPTSVAVCHDPTEVVDLLEGFEVVVAEVARRPVDTAEGERVALDTVVVARRS